MSINSFLSATSSIQNAGYLAVFLLMVIEGPIVTYAAAAAAALGIFDIWIILVLSLFGNLAPDVLFYSLGRLARGGSIERYIGRLGLSKSRIKKLEYHLKNHAGKTLSFVKLIPPFPIPGLILAGFAKVPINKFLLVDILFNVISAILFTALGFYSAMAVSSVAKFFKAGEIVIPVLVVLSLLAYFAIRMTFKKISEKEKVRF